MPMLPNRVQLGLTPLERFVAEGVSEMAFSSMRVSSNSKVEAVEEKGGQN